MMMSVVIVLLQPGSMQICNKKRSIYTLYLLTALR